MSGEPYMPGTQESVERQRREFIEDIVQRAKLSFDARIFPTPYMMSPRTTFQAGAAWAAEQFWAAGGDWTLPTKCTT